MTQRIMPNDDAGEDHDRSGSRYRRELALCAPGGLVGVAMCGWPDDNSLEALLYSSPSIDRSDRFHHSKPETILLKGG